MDWRISIQRLNLIIFGKLKSINNNMNKKLKDDMAKEFEIGNAITYEGRCGEILNLHSNYATIVCEGSEHKVWLHDLVLSDIQVKRDQLYKESLIYKGYRTTNFTRVLSEVFKEFTKEVSDTYAMLECIKVLDYILGVNDTTILEDYSIVKVQSERLKRYSKKIGSTYVTESFVSVIEEELLKYAILEGLRFTTTDRNMVAKVIAMTAGISVSSTVDPTNTVNQAAIVFRRSQLTPQGWEMLGRLFTVARKSGIRYNVDIFSGSQIDMMKINK